jgi:ring-1,2-phenylacetyl-CoA epoxidase subunit PaaD
MVIRSHTKEEIFNILSVIPDPEIPVVNLEEMGMLRDVHITDNGYIVFITPTYTGCPAMGIIEQDIKMTLNANGVSPVVVKMVYDPAWTTDWMSDKAKEKLRIYGIAPPLHSSCSQDVFSHNIIKCPRCGSSNTTMLSRFGATACKSLYQCNDCKEPFEYFKCH